MKLSIPDHYIWYVPPGIAWMAKAFILLALCFTNLTWSIPPASQKQAHYCSMFKGNILYKRSCLTRITIHIYLKILSCADYSGELHSPPLPTNKHWYVIHVLPFSIYSLLESDQMIAQQFKSAISLYDSWFIIACSFVCHSVVFIIHAWGL